MVVCEHMEVLLGWQTCVGTPVIVPAVSCTCVNVCMCVRSPGVSVTHLHTCLKQTGILTHGLKYVTPE